MKLNKGNCLASHDKVSVSILRNKIRLAVDACCKKTRMHLGRWSSGLFKEEMKPKV